LAFVRFTFAYVYGFLSGFQPFENFFSCEEEWQLGIVNLVFST
jgi:hypothetical protein